MKNISYKLIVLSLLFLTIFNILGLLFTSFSHCCIFNISYPQAFLKRSLFLQAYDLMSYTAYVLHSVEDFEKISN